MSALLQLPLIRSLHQRQFLFPVVVAAVVFFILFQGAVQQSDPAQATQEPSTSVPVLVEPPRPTIIRADLEKTPLTYVSDYWAQLAKQTGPHLTLVGEPPVPAVLVRPRLAVTTASVAVSVLETRKRAVLTGVPDTYDETASTAPDEPWTFRLRGWDATIGLALFDVTSAQGAPVTLTDPRGMPSGSYLGAVTLGPDGAPIITPGYLATTVDDETVVGSVGDLVVSMDLPSTVGSVYVLHRLFPFSIYTLKLCRRGIDFPHREEAERMGVKAEPTGARSLA